MLTSPPQVRLALARILWKRPHILILDEITTHLDFHTVLALTAALSTYNGAILLVSHDRFLMRRVIEGKKADDGDDNGDDDAGAAESDAEYGEESSRRREVFVLRGGKLHRQADGVEQFERSLEKRVRKMMSAGSGVGGKG